MLTYSAAGFRVLASRKKSKGPGCRRAQEAYVSEEIARTISLNELGFRFSCTQMWEGLPGLPYVKIRRAEPQTVRTKKGAIQPWKWRNTLWRKILFVEWM